MGRQGSTRCWLCIVGLLHVFVASSFDYKSNCYGDLLLRWTSSSTADGFAEGLLFSWVAALSWVLESAGLLLTWLLSWNWSAYIPCTVSNVASAFYPGIHWGDSATFGSCILFCNYFWPSRYWTVAGYIFHINSESSSSAAVSLRSAENLEILSMPNMWCAQCPRAWAAATLTILTSSSGFWFCLHITDSSGRNSHF